MGTKFSLKDPNPGVWFTFDPEDPESGRICIRIVNGAKLREIETLVSKWEWKDGKKIKIPADWLDPNRLKLHWDYMIVEWERLEDNEGKPLECTPENKFKLMNEEPRFFAFVNACSDLLKKEVEEVQAKIIKN